MSGSSCQICGKDQVQLSDHHKLILCPGCEAMVYCSEKHRIYHQQNGHDAEECARMKQQMSRLSELLDLPFSFYIYDTPCELLTALNLHPPTPPSSLETKNDNNNGNNNNLCLHQQPTVWSRLCSCGSPDATERPWGSLAPLLPSPPQLQNPEQSQNNNSNNNNRLILTRQQVETALLSQHWWGTPPPPLPLLPLPLPSTKESIYTVDPGIKDWERYYSTRGLVLQDSPPPAVALVLDTVMTVYWAIQQYLTLILHTTNNSSTSSSGSGGSSSGNEQKQKSSSSSSLCIHIVGPQKEIDQWPLLLELGGLLPCWIEVLDIHLIGPHVPVHLHNYNITICGDSGTKQQKQHSSGNDNNNNNSNSPRTATNTTSITFWHGEYHTLYPSSDGTTDTTGTIKSNTTPNTTTTTTQQQQPPIPDVVVGCNAGLAAYSSWIDTLLLIQSHAVQKASSTSSTSSGGVGDTGDHHPITVCVYTDYNEEAVYRAIHMSQHVLLGHLREKNQNQQNGGDGEQLQQKQVVEVEIHGPVLNPFRQPFLLQQGDNRLPSMSNAFAMTHIYSSKNPNHNTNRQKQQQT